MNEFNIDGRVYFGLQGVALEMYLTRFTFGFMKENRGRGSVDCIKAYGLMCGCQKRFRDHLTPDEYNVADSLSRDMESPLHE